MTYRLLASDGQITLVDNKTMKLLADHYDYFTPITEGRWSRTDSDVLEMPADKQTIDTMISVAQGVTPMPHMGEFLLFLNCGNPYKKLVEGLHALGKSVDSPEWRKALSLIPSAPVWYGHDLGYEDFDIAMIGSLVKRVGSPAKVKLSSVDWYAVALCASHYKLPNKVVDMAVVLSGETALVGSSPLCVTTPKRIYKLMMREPIALVHNPYHNAKSEDLVMPTLRYREVQVITKRQGALIIDLPSSFMVMDLYQPFLSMALSLVKRARSLQTRHSLLLMCGMSEYCTGELTLTAKLLLDSSDVSPVRMNPYNVDLSPLGVVRWTTEYYLQEGLQLPLSSEVKQDLAAVLLHHAMEWQDDSLSWSTPPSLSHCLRYAEETMASN